MPYPPWRPLSQVPLSLPLEIEQHIVRLTAEDGNLPPSTAPFYGQDPYWGTSMTFLSTPSYPCISMPLICRSLRKYGEQALYTNISVNASNIVKLFKTIDARNELGSFVRCVNIGYSEQPNAELGIWAKEQISDLLELCPQVSEIVAQWLPEDIAQDLASILGEANTRSPLQCITLSDNHADFLPSFPKSATQFPSLRVLRIGSIALREGDLIPYFGSRLQRLELTYLVVHLGLSMPSFEELQQLVKGSPELKELVLVGCELANFNSRCINDFFFDLVAALSHQLESLVLDGGSEPDTKWSDYPPITEAWEEVICQCVKLHSLYLRRITLRKIECFAELKVAVLHIIQCFINERPPGWRARGLPNLPPAKPRIPEGKERTVCKWVVYANSRAMQKEAQAEFEQEIYNGDWPPKISPC